LETDYLSIPQGKEFEGMILNVKCSPAVHTLNLETESLPFYKRLDQEIN
jgi:hypothetical protein